MDAGVTTVVGEQQSYVLYAEDNPTDYLFFLRAFSRENPGLPLVHRENGKQIKTYLLDCVAKKAPLPSVVVLDIKMPGLSGLDVLAFIRQHPRLHRLPVVLLSASEEQRDLDRAYDFRVNAYLVKPNRFQQLKDLVKTMSTFWVHYNRITYG